ncbi:uncharacterized protein LAESUDRAFT_611137, partial [Laetiporus sulphureus 93-53]
IAIPRPPSVVLGKSLHAGVCWPMNGSTGHLGLRLPSAMHVTHISIDHIPLDLTEDIQAAPRDLVLWGLSEDLVPLASISYDIYAPAYRQLFETDVRFQALSFDMLVLEVLSNWGASEFTCLYSVRLQG